MAGTREKAEEIVSKLRQVEVLPGQGATIADAVHQIGVTQQTFYRWRTLYGGMQRSQLARLKELEKEIFDTLDDARRKLALWRYDYNAVRPHASLGNQTPFEVRRTLEKFEGSAPGALAQNGRPD